MQKRTIFTTICLLLCLPAFLAFPGTPVPAAQPADDRNAAEDDSVYEAYQEYSARLAAVSQASDIPKCGFDIVEDQIFPFSLTVPAGGAETADEASGGPDHDGSTGTPDAAGAGGQNPAGSTGTPDAAGAGGPDRAGSTGRPDAAGAGGPDPADTEGFTAAEDDADTVYLIPAFDQNYDRLILFFADPDGTVFCKTDQLEMNCRNTGQLKQPNKSMSAISFQDLNGDLLTDIIILTSCVNDDGAYARKSYKIGDVLFQTEQTAGFYRDYRISDKINRFGMNKSADEITAFVRDGSSAEFMYTASTLDELTSHGMRIIEEQCYTRTFEKPGRLQVVPGVCRVGNYDIFMIYLADEQGCIVSCLQPMGEADNLYALKGIQCRDIDGDGLKDIVVLARYSYEEADGQFTVKSDYSVYYQRTGGFSADTAIKESCPCADGDTMEQLVERLRAYWGWHSEQ